MISLIKLNIFLFTITIILSITITNGVRFDISNNCPYTVWPASFPAGGGRRLDGGQTWSIYIPPGTKVARIWARTGCAFDRSGRGRCLTGDCNGQLHCRTYGSPPNTLARIALNQYQNIDYFDISLVEGFNVAMEFKPNSGGNCTRGPRCAPSDIVEQCPSELRVRGGCNGACTVFNTSDYCCSGESCGPTDYSRFFRSKCPEAYSYPTENTVDTVYTCPSGTGYRVVFCPNN